MYSQINELFFLFKQVISLVIINLERYKYGLPSSGLMFTYWSFMSMTSILLIYSHYVSSFIQVEFRFVQFQLQNSILFLCVFVYCFYCVIKQNEFEFKYTNAVFIVYVLFVNLNLLLACIPDSVVQDKNRNPVSILRIMV